MFSNIRPLCLQKLDPFIRPHIKGNNATLEIPLESNRPWTKKLNDKVFVTVQM